MNDNHVVPGRESRISDIRVEITEIIQQNLEANGYAVNHDPEDDREEIQDIIDQVLIYWIAQLEMRLERAEELIGYSVPHHVVRDSDRHRGLSVEDALRSRIRHLELELEKERRDDEEVEEEVLTPASTPAILEEPWT